MLRNIDWEQHEFRSINMRVFRSLQTNLIFKVWCNSNKRLAIIYEKADNLRVLQNLDEIVDSINSVLSNISRVLKCQQDESMKIWIQRYYAQMQNAREQLLLQAQLKRYYTRLKAKHLKEYKKLDVDALNGEMRNNVQIFRKKRQLATALCVLQIQTQ